MSMNRFVTDLITSPVTDEFVPGVKARDRWMLKRLVAPLIYLHRDRRIIVPGGFISDLATVPRIFWTIFPRDGDYERAAVVHDYLCYRLFHEDAHPLARTRSQAASVFLEAMDACGTAKATRWMLYASVMAAKDLPGVAVTSTVNPPGL